MTSRLNLALVFHAHQPPSNPESVVEQVIKTSYYPVLKKMAECPWLRCSLHLSGSLLERLERLAPEVIRLIEHLLAAGRLELLGGGYHEPLLPFIPAIDRKEQILALRRKIKKTFGVEPKGMWLAERIWEPDLAGDLSRAGVDFTLLDEHGFLQAGFEDSQLTSHFLTEDQGQTLGIFPISKALRYLLPFADREQVRLVLNDRAQRFPGSLWTFADDLEKFGSWPGTYQRVHEKGWLAEFLDLLSQSSEWLSTVTLSEARQKVASKGLAYLPTTSYPEMTRWSLPPQVRAETWRSGNPKNFLVRYPEINLLHKRMLMASEAVHSGPRPSPQTLDLLWQSQTACVYWFGWFGGSYLPLLRLNARSAACRAETTAMKRFRRRFNYLEQADLDVCGSPEIMASTAAQWLLFQPRGGCLLAWEDRHTGFDTLAAMPCHDEESGRPPSRLCQVQAFEDLFLPTGMSVEEVMQKPDILLGKREKMLFDASFSEEPAGHVVELKAVFPLHFHNKFLPIQIGKTFRIPLDGVGFGIEIELGNRGEQTADLAYGLRVPFSVAMDRPFEYQFLSFPELGLLNLHGSLKGEACGIQEVRMSGEQNTAMTITSDRPLTVWYHPLSTQLMVEGKDENVIQGSILYFVVNFRLEAGEHLAFRLQFKKGPDPDHG